MAGGTQTDADIFDGSAFGGAKSLTGFSGTATGSATGQPNGPELSTLAVDPIEGTAVVGVFILPPTTWPAAPITQPTGTAVGGATPTPIFWDPSPLLPPAGVAVGGAILEPVPLPAPVVQPPAAVGGGGAIPAPVPLDPIGINFPIGIAIGGGGAVPIGPPQVPVQPPAAVGGGGATISLITIDPVPASPPTGAAIGTDPTIIPLPIPATPVSPPTGTGGGGGTTSPATPAGPATTAPGGGAVGGGGATPTGPAQVPVTAPTGTGTGTVTTSPTLPSVPVTTPTGAAVGGNASTGITEPIQAPTVTAPTATVTVGSTATGPSVNLTGSQAVVAPTVSTTVANGGTTTQTIACKCCGAASDPCCGPFDRTGHYFNRWFKGTEWSSGIVGRGKTTAPAKFLLSMSFGSAGTWSSPGDGNSDLQQNFELEFEYYDPGEAISLPYPFRRYEVARWTNTGPVKCRLLSGTSWEDGSATDGTSGYRGKAGNVWLNFESEYIYLLTGYRNTNQFTSTYQTDDKVNSFVLLSSLENLDTDTFSYVQNNEAAKPSSYKVFFQRWNPKTASVYGYRYLMKTAQCRQAILGPTIDQLTWVPSINGCSLQIQTEGNRSTATPGGNAIAYSVEPCTVGSNVFGPLFGNCNSFGANLILRRDQSCQCPNGYAQQLFGPNGLCSNLDLGLGRVELQAELTAYTHVSPYTSSNTSTPQIPFSLGYFGNGFGNPCLDFTGGNGLWFLGARDDTNYPVFYISSSFKFELQNSGDPITAKPITNNNGNLVGWDGWIGTWSELTAWKKTYSTSTALRGPVPASGPAPMQLQYVSHSCSPFSMTFAGSLWMKYDTFGSAFDKHIANIEITFFLPQNGLISMAGPPAQTINPTVAQALIEQSKTRLALPCVHRGQALEETASCGCGGAVLTECAVYGQCRPYGTATDAQVCTRCPDYAAP